MFEYWHDFKKGSPTRVLANKFFSYLGYWTPKVGFDPKNMSRKGSPTEVLKKKNVFLTFFSKFFPNLFHNFYSNFFSTFFHQFFANLFLQLLWQLFYKLFHNFFHNFLHYFSNMYNILGISLGWRLNAFLRPDFTFLVVSRVFTVRFGSDFVATFRGGSPLGGGHVSEPPQMGLGVKITECKPYLAIL